MSYFVDVRTLDRQDADSNVSLNIDGELDLNEWIYDISFSDLVGDGSYDIVRVIELIGGIHGRLVTRYFLVKANGMAIALARQIDDENCERICSSYIYSIDALLSRHYKHRVFPFKARVSFDNYSEISAEIFTPVISTKGERYNTEHYIKLSNQWNDNEYLSWLDKVALQGWFPAHVLSTLSVTPPPHTGWDIDGSHMSEIHTLLQRPCELDLPYHGDTHTKFPEHLMSSLTRSTLLDFKVVVDFNPNDDSFTHRDTIRSFEYYDPKRGDVYDLESLDTKDYNDELVLITRVIDSLVLCLKHDGVDMRDISSVTIYRCLNDLVYVMFNTSENHMPFGYLVIDYVKRLCVHYGYVDIPVEAVKG